MTAIFYPDCEAMSANGKFRLEARSPHNGTINHQNGKPATEEEFGFLYRDHQKHFRYQLEDMDSGLVLWEAGRKKTRTRHANCSFRMKDGR